LAVPALALLPIGIVADRRYPAMVDLHFAAHARRVSAALPGETLSLPINPPGWRMILTKRREAAMP
jgi:hypothetical protein